MKKDKNPVRIIKEFDGSVQIFTLCALVLISLVILYFRYSSSMSGFPSDEWDYGSHIAIINYILNANFFPQMNNVEVSPHAIASWLPVYHGIIGAHVPVALLSLIGVSIPKAMLIISDFSLLLVFLSLNALSGKFIKKCFIFLFLILPSFSIMVSQGFYSIIVGSAFAFCGLILYMKNYYKLSLIVFLYAFFCYPDFLIWLGSYAGILLYKLKEKNYFQRILAGVLFFMAFSLFVVLINRNILLEGGITWPLTYILSLAFLIGYLRLFSKSDLITIAPKMSVYFLATSFILIIIPMIAFRDFSVQYYARKYTYWSVLFLSILLLDLRFPKKIITILILLILIGVIPKHKLYFKSMADLLTATSGFTPVDASEMNSIKNSNHCTNYFYIPLKASKTLNLGITATKSIAIYSYLNKYDVYTSNILRSDFLAESERSVGGLTVRYASEANSDAEIKKLMDQIAQKNLDVCFIVPDSRKNLVENVAINLDKNIHKNLLYRLKK